MLGCVPVVPDRDPPKAVEISTSSAIVRARDAAPAPVSAATIMTPTSLAATMAAAIELAPTADSVAQPENPRAEVNGAAHRPLRTGSGKPASPTAALPSFRTWTLAPRLTCTSCVKPLGIENENPCPESIRTGVAWLPQASKAVAKTTKCWPMCFIAVILP